MISCRWARVQAALASLAMALAIPMAARRQASDAMKALNQPVPPFHIIGNIYYVGASDITSYLIVTPKGDIVIDGGFVDTAPQIEANIARLGFRLSDVKYVLNSHAHLDHAGGISELRNATGAQFVAMDGDVAALEAGTTFPVTKPDRIIHDGDAVSLGDVTLTAHLTPGHTRGCTTWTMTTRDGGKTLNVVFVGSATVLPQYKLIERPGAPATYPGIEQDYEKTIRVLKSLPCDVFLASHGSFYGLTQKREAMAKSPAQNPFIDPAGYQAYVARAEGAFQAELKKEQAQAN